MKKDGNAWSLSPVTKGRRTLPYLVSGVTGGGSQESGRWQDAALGPALTRPDSWSLSLLPRWMDVWRAGLL